LIFASFVALPFIAAADGLAAVADLKGCTNSAITGTARLQEQVTPEGVKEVTVDLKVQCVPDGRHAVLIHEVGACEPCSAAGGHHDPGPAGQSRPDSAMDTVPATDINHPFHMGDLINLDVKNGIGSLRHTTNRVTLAPGRLGIFDADGSAIVVHTQADTYCDEESDLKQGCAGGAREACGILRLVK
jgi:Cu-Zn family superoxide dismutase